MEKREIPSWDEIRATIAKMSEENAIGFAELRRSQEETAEQMRKTDEQLRAMIAETDKKQKKTDAKIDGIDKNSGYHAEQYFQNALANKLSFGRIKYDYMTPNLTYQRKDKTAEFDIALFNGKSVAIIEAKNRIHPDFIKEIAEEKVAQFRKYFPAYKDYDLYLGVAGFSFAKKVEEEAKKYGVGIIRQVGNSVEIDDSNLKVY